MPRTEAQIRATKKWNDKNMAERYERIQVIVQKGERAVLKSLAKEKGYSVSKYIIEAVNEKAGYNALTMPYSETEK